MDMMELEQAFTSLREIKGSNEFVLPADALEAYINIRKVMQKISIAFISESQADLLEEILQILPRVAKPRSHLLHIWDGLIKKLQLRFGGPVKITSDDFLVFDMEEPILHKIRENSQDTENYASVVSSKLETSFSE